MHPEKPMLIIVFNQWFSEPTGTTKEERKNQSEVKFVPRPEDGGHSPQVPEVICEREPEAERYSQSHERMRIRPSAGSNPSIQIWDSTCDACNRQV